MSNNPDPYNWETNALFPLDAYSMRYPAENDGGPPSYQGEGFLSIQNAIAKAYIDLNPKHPANAAMPEIFAQRFPFPAHRDNYFASSMSMLIPLFFLMSLNYTFTNSIRFIAIEKEKQLKEAMKIMGLANWMHYLSWFIRTLIILLISMVLITVLVTV